MARLTLVFLSLVIIVRANLVPSSPRMLFAQEKWDGFCRNFKRIMDRVGDRDDKLVPDLIFITNRPSQIPKDNMGGPQVGEVAEGFKFKPNKISLNELVIHGFNPQAPVYFAVHGFGGGYDRGSWLLNLAWEFKRGSRLQTSSSGSIVEPSIRNLIIIDWHYGARVPNYANAIRNVPIVAKFVSEFINTVLLGEARVDPSNIQLIGHSLGAHLASQIARGTRKPGRIYSLDAAGPCFGQKLAGEVALLDASDADELITIHTDTDCLGNQLVLGDYSIYVEEGCKQPGCSNNCPVTLKGMWEGLSSAKGCSHQRATDLVTQRYDQGDSEEGCEMVAYGCTKWDDFLKGFCGVCAPSDQVAAYKKAHGNNNSPMDPVECLRIGLDWQYASPIISPSSWTGKRKEKSRNGSVPLYMRTGNKQPYCIFQYRAVLELNEPLPIEFPPMKLTLAKNWPTETLGYELSSPQFNNRFNDMYYTDLIVSNKNLSPIAIASITLDRAHKDGNRVFKSLVVNHLSHSDPITRQRLSSRLCPVKTDLTWPRIGNDGRSHYLFTSCERIGR